MTDDDLNVQQIKTCPQCAELFGVGMTTVFKVVHRVTWRGG